MTIYLCERCGSRFNAARFAHIELCPRCLLRDDAASHLVSVPDKVAPRSGTERSGSAGEDQAGNAGTDTGTASNRPS